MDALTALEMPHGTCLDIEAVLGCLLNRGLSPEEDAAWFANRRHDELIRTMLDYLNAHRHYLGYCQIRDCHALNERGIDLVLSAEGFKAGLQIKSHRDVKKNSFSVDVKRQFADALSHGLNHYYLLICSPLTDGKKNLRPRINNLLNDMALYKNVKLTFLTPTGAVKLFREPSQMSRDELLTRRAISDDYWYEHEKGYEHLPEVEDDEAIVAANKRLAKFGDSAWCSEEGLEASRACVRLVQQKQAAQFTNTFAPTLPPEIQHKRAKLISGIKSLLAECRESKHWGDKEEDRLHNYLEEVPVEMIPYTSIPNLLRMHEKLEGLSLFLSNMPDEPPPLKIPAKDFQQVVKKYYRAKNERLVLQALEDRDIWLARGYRIAYYPGTQNEIQVKDCIALLVPENV